MILPLLATIAFAGTTAALPREGEALTKRKWWTVQQLEEGPARPKWRNRRGAWECWTWPDGVAARCIGRKGRTPLRDIRFDVSGQPATTTVYEDGSPAKVVVHQATEHTIALTGWQETDLGGVVVPATVLGAPTQEGWAWTLNSATLRARWLPDADDLFEAGFSARLQNACACIVEDQAATLVLDGLAVRYRLRHLAAVPQASQEFWAIPVADRTLLMGITIDHELGTNDRTQRLALARAIVSQLRTAPEGT